MTSDKSKTPDTPASHHTPGFRHILCCTDFSDNATSAFKSAAELARLQSESKLTLLHVIPEPEAQFWRTYIYEVDEDVDSKARRDIDAKIDETYRPLTPDGMELDIQIRIGADYNEILDFARENDIDLIVLGHRGHSRLKGMFSAGNVAEKVVRNAPCAVLVVTGDK